MKREIGRIYRVWLGPGFTRRAEVLALRDGMAFVRWVDYALSNEWIREDQL